MLLFLFLNLREKNIQLFKDYFLLLSGVKNKIKHDEILKY